LRHGGEEFQEGRLRPHDNYRAAVNRGPPNARELSGGRAKALTSAPTTC
jgi:hypothetical protein